MDSFKTALAEDSYFRQEELTFADCDRNKNIRISALLRKAANYAGYDYDARGLTHEKLLEMREAFLLSRMAVRVHRCPRAREVLDITTWENGAKGVHMQRVYELRDQEGRLCAAIKSDWILVDPVTRKILRPNSFTAKAFTVCPKEIDCPDTRKIPPLKEGAAALGLRRIVWSDLDGNGHVYSANYGDIVWDYLPGDLQERIPREFYINYSKETTLGEDLRLLGLREGEGYRMEGLGPEGACFTALCVF